MPSVYLLASDIHLHLFPFSFSDLLIWLPGSWLLVQALSLRRASAASAAVCGLPLSRLPASTLGAQALGAGAQRLWPRLRWPQAWESAAGGPGMEPCPLRWKSASCPLDHEAALLSTIGLSFSSCLAGEFCIYSRHKPLLKCVSCQYSLPVCSFSYSLNRVCRDKDLNFDHGRK